MFKQVSKTMLGGALALGMFGALSAANAAVDTYIKIGRAHV